MMNQHKQAAAVMKEVHALRVQHFGPTHSKTTSAAVDIVRLERQQVKEEQTQARLAAQDMSSGQYLPCGKFQRHSSACNQCGKWQAHVQWEGVPERGTKCDKSTACSIQMEAQKDMCQGCFLGFVGLRYGPCDPPHAPPFLRSGLHLYSFWLRGRSAQRQQHQLGFGSFG